MDVTSEELAEAVESQHGGVATFVQAVPVQEEFNGVTVWSGVVHIFDLTENTSATRAYAWSHALDGTDRRRFVAVLHAGPVNSPLTAVRAALVAEQRSKT